MCEGYVFVYICEEAFSPSVPIFSDKSVSRKAWLVFLCLTDHSVRYIVFHCVLVF